MVCAAIHMSLVGIGVPLRLSCAAILEKRYDILNCELGHMSCSGNSWPFLSLDLAALTIWLTDE